MTSSTVMIVEDDELSSFMMSELLSTLGVDVETASSGAECLDRLSTEPGKFGLVLMDIHMPVQTGDQTTAKIRSFGQHPPKNLPVVAVTADPVWSDESRRESVGLDDYLPKPIAAQELANVCKRYGIDLSPSS